MQPPRSQAYQWRGAQQLGFHRHHLVMTRRWRFENLRDFAPPRPGHRKMPKLPPCEGETLRHNARSSETLASRRDAVFRIHSSFQGAEKTLRRWRLMLRLLRRWLHWTESARRAANTAHKRKEAYICSRILGERCRCLAERSELSEVRDNRVRTARFKSGVRMRALLGAMCEMLRACGGLEPEN
ncbi:hypothetical protein BKA93DRAFT_571792 [Sparassis latifolia]